MRRVISVAFSSDVSRVMSGSVDGWIRVSDAETGKELKKLEGPTRNARSVSFSNDGTLIASSSYKMSFWIWDASTVIPARSTQSHFQKMMSGLHPALTIGRCGFGPHQLGR